jgi:uncharacterized membrane protein
MQQKKLDDEPCKWMDGRMAGGGMWLWPVIGVAVVVLLVVVIAKLFRK